MTNQAAQTMPEPIAAMIEQVSNVENLIDDASRQYHDSTRWAEEPSVYDDRSSPTLQEAIDAGFNKLRDMLRDYAAALSQTAGVHEPGCYFAGGPQGHFFADDLQLARDLVNLYDKDDDWTITDLRNPTGVSPAASGGEPAASVSERARELVAKWREDAEIADRNTEGNSYASCADELESLLSAASDHQQNAAQGGGE